MKSLLVFAAVAGLALVSASPPQHAGSGESRASGGYPPCSRTVTDRCIQLYERGVRTAANMATNRRLGPLRYGMAQGGPYEPVPSRAADRGGWQAPTSRSGYPECSRLVTDRCIQMYERGVTGRGN